MFTYTKRIGKVILISIITCLIFSNELFAKNILMRENFETSSYNLKKKGWILPAGCSIVSDVQNKSNHVLKIITPKGQFKTVALFYFPVKKGKIYSGTVKVRCNNVQKLRVKEKLMVKERGASLFFELATGKKSWVLGGSFVKGIFGTHKKWQKVKILNTIRIAPPVEFLKVYLVIEGSGTAEFDDLEICEFDESRESVKRLYPANGKKLTNSQPVFKWDLNNVKSKPQAVVLISQDSSFSENETFSIFDKKRKGYAKPDFALAAGKWYWKIRLFFDRFMFESPKIRTFTISQGSAVSPVKIIPLWSNTYSADKRPLLKVRIYPKQKISTNNVKIEINGQAGKIKSVKNNTIAFEPSMDLNQGLHTVTLGFKEQISEFYYCNKKSGNKITFRKDNIALVNGAPFFPLGTYRDPSNSLTDFSGIKEAGFNLTHSYYFEEKEWALEAAQKYLDLAEKNGLMVFMGIPRKKIATFDAKSIEKFCAKLKSSKALLNWYFDEPGANSLALSETFKAIRNVDKDHPFNITFCTLPGKSFSMNGIFDLMWTDNYPVVAEKFPTLGYEQFLLEAKKIAISQGTPHWVVLQGHDLCVWPNKTSKTVRFPSPPQTRFMAHLALSTDATGLVWYWGPAYNLRSQTVIWKGICDTVQELRKLTPYLTGNRNKYKVRLPKSFRYWSATANGKRVLTIINTKHKSINLKFSARHLLNKKMTYFGTNQKVNISKGYIEEVFPPLGVKIYLWNE